MEREAVSQGGSKAGRLRFRRKRNREVIRGRAATKLKGRDAKKTPDEETTKRQGGRQSQLKAQRRETRMPRRNI